MSNMNNALMFPHDVSDDWYILFFLASKALHISSEVLIMMTIQDSLQVVDDCILACKKEGT